ncbi:DNA polymerase III, alpha chain PolC-type [Staphylococcus saprophyticus]|uniref:exonuclease domain-containing protein n=1 Tax=Staphylococcus saprophyticus TaxID=29385 RepID=UPI000E02D183|nr:exonuclease domain-containing protein [Staphylococcus saprophyticus]SUM78682.1 DNA polymerase III, alpha chain PolC-type [Staphylococcus saprophyticus]
MDFVAIDLETANADRSSICALGMVKVKGNEIIETYYTLVNPETYFDGFNVMIHGIDEEDVVDSPTYENIYDDITTFTNGYNLVAHSTRFDMYAIADCMTKYNLPIWTNNYFCSQRISEELRTGLASYRLNDLVYQFGLTPFDHHNALEDAKASAEIITYFIQNNELESVELFCDTHNFKIGKLNKNGFVKQQNSKATKIELDYNNIIPQEDNIFFDKKICFTGKLQKYTRKEVAQVVTNIGANWVDRVTKDVNYLVIGNLENLEKATGYKESSKIKKAKANAKKRLPIQILSELEFYQEMESGE